MCAMVIIGMLGLAIFVPSLLIVIVSAHFQSKRDLSLRCQLGLNQNKSK